MGNLFWNTNSHLHVRRKISLIMATKSRYSLLGECIWPCFARFVFMVLFCMWGWRSWHISDTLGFNGGVLASEQRHRRSSVAHQGEVWEFQDFVCNCYAELFGALSHHFALFCALLCSCVCARLCSFVLVRALLLPFCVSLRPTAFSTTAFGNFRIGAALQGTNTNGDKRQSAVFCGFPQKSADFWQEELIICKNLQKSATTPYPTNTPVPSSRKVIHIIFSRNKICKRIFIHIRYYSSPGICSVKISRSY